MGKILFALLIIAALLCVPFTTVSAASLPDSATYYVYCGYCEMGDVTDVGGNLIVRCNGDNVRRILQTAQNVYGVSATITGDHNTVREIISYFNLSYVANSIDGYLCIYGYTDLIPDYISVSGDKINLQIVLKEGVVYIGTPVLLGSY